MRINNIEGRQQVPYHVPKVTVLTITDNRIQYRMSKKRIKNVQKSHNKSRNG